VIEAEHPFKLDANILENFDERRFGDQALLGSVGKLSGVYSLGHI
jgi:hypothetical protein